MISIHIVVVSRLLTGPYLMAWLVSCYGDRSTKSMNRGKIRDCLLVRHIIDAAIVERGG